MADACGGSCLRAPTYLGTHSLSLSESKLLDDGRLHVWVGAAVHSTGCSAAGYPAPDPVHGEDSVFAAVKGSGSRRVGGAFLRVALQKCDEEAPSPRDFVHLWLDLPGEESSTLGGGPAVESSMSAVQRIGPYRLRVLQIELTVSDAPDQECALKRAESMIVTFAADRVRSRHAAGQQLLPPVGDSALLWLSTQGALQVSFGGAAADARASFVPVEGEEAALRLEDSGLESEATNGKYASSGACSRSEPTHSSLCPRGDARLEALSPIRSVAPGSRFEPDALFIRLHAVARAPPARSVGIGAEAGARGVDAGFGCDASAWRAELDVMCLGEAEEHLVLQLEVGCTARRRRVGKFDIFVERCAGHYSRTDPQAGHIESDYPILLLHVLLRVVRLAHLPVDDVGQMKEQAALGAGLERLLGLGCSDDGL